MSASKINEFEVTYARFNALKTFSTNVPSEFEHLQLADLEVTRDRSRSDAYYNRILGLTAASANYVSQAISWIEAGTEPGRAVRADISETDLQEVGDAQEHLENLGFRHVDTLVWLRLARPDGESATSAAQHEPGNPRLLTFEDWPALRELLELAGPIDDAIWHHKRNHLCTTTFRWFGRFEDASLVSAASTWTTGNLAILGSAFTRSTHRGQGHQRQLLELRKRLTPGSLFVDVAPESTSHRNCLRAGFTDLDHRQVWVRDVAT